MFSWKYYFFFTFLCIALQGFFAMFEMASVSFNKIRLQYYVSKDNRRAKWLSSLIRNPSYLFGTTLIGVNTFLQMGSEFSRQLYESWHLSPDFAPLSQVLLVVVFGELSPMFAARRHSEQVAMLCVPIIYFLSRLLTPIIFFIDGVNRFLHHLFKKKIEAKLFFTREEIQKAFEERDTQIIGHDPFATITVRIFNLKYKVAKEVMTPLHLAQLVPSECTVEEVRRLLSFHYSPFIPIYHREHHNIIAVAYPRDLLQVEAKKKVVDHSRSPWFITDTDSLLHILEQFRRNSQSVAIVLSSHGVAMGILTLDDLVDEIFGEPSDAPYPPEMELLPPPSHIERTLPGHMEVADFNEKFHANVEHKEEETLSELMVRVLGHPPAKGESIQTDNFSFTVIKPSLFGAKTILVVTSSVVS